MPDVDVWADVAPGRDDPSDPEVTEVVCAVRPGVEILEAEVAGGGGLLRLRLRVPFDAREEYRRA